MPAPPRPRKPGRQSVAALAARSSTPSNQPGLGLVAALAAHLAAQHQAAALKPRVPIFGAQSAAYDAGQLRQATRQQSITPQVGGL